MNEFLLFGKCLQICAFTEEDGVNEADAPSSLLSIVFALILDLGIVTIVGLIYRYTIYNSIIFVRRKEIQYNFCMGICVVLEIL